MARPIQFDIGSIRAYASTEHRANRVRLAIALTSQLELETRQQICSGRDQPQFNVLSPQHTGLPRLIRFHGPHSYSPSRLFHSALVHVVLCDWVLRTIDR